MAATQEALDGLDDVTLDLVVVLQLRDVATMLEQDGDGTSATPTSAAIGLAVTEELLQYRADRRFEKRETELAEASALAVAGGLANIQCASCNDNFLAEEVWQAPCSHRYCFPCLEHLHSASMRDETLYPPRCCKLVMPWDNVKDKISEELVTSFEKKKEELDTPTDKRTYCSDAKCAMFIGTKHIAKDVAACPACKKATCTMCKASLHHHEDCPADPALEETLTLAFNFGWQRCAKCKRVVDLAFGCYHITYVFLSLTVLATADQSQMYLSSRVLLPVRSRLEDVCLSQMGR